MATQIQHGKSTNKRRRVRTAVQALDGLAIADLTNAQLKTLLLAVAYKTGLINDALQIDTSVLLGDADG